MKRLIGLCLFWLGIGMALYWILPDNFFCICLMAACIAGGYYLFCGCQWIETWIMIDEGLLFYGGSFLHDEPGGALLWGNAVSYEKKFPAYQAGNRFGTHFYALSTRPDFRQEVHTYIFLVPPFTFTLTDFTLELHILLDFLLEWLTLFPKWAPFSQIAHFAMIAPPYTDLAGLRPCQTHNIKHNIRYKKKKQANLYQFFKKIIFLFCPKKGIIS